jgi:hypothetical protein
MKIAARWLVVSVLLFFAWRGSILDLHWPPLGSKDRGVPTPSTEALKFAEPLRPFLSKMTPKDRMFLASFYDATAYILLRDAERSQPIISDTEKFASFHSGSLQLAIDRKDVGKYPGLGQAIDEVFLSAAGAEIVPMSEKTRNTLIGACGVISWSFGIKRDE